MKNLLIAALLVSPVLGLLSCGSAHGDDPGDAYMPDMYYSRAYEAYGYNNVGGENDSLRNRGIYFNGMLVPGSIARGDALPTYLTNDSTGLLAADGMVSPYDTTRLSEKDMREAERLYLVNCGICHGTALDGNGPLWKDGDGPYPAKPQVLNDANAKAWTDGHYYHVITYGKGAMGSYASQLRPQQRWMVIEYIRSKQNGGGTDSVANGTTPNMTQSSPNNAVDTSGM